MSNQAKFVGLDEGIFFTIIYCTIASIINILVCVLAARDTYKRVKINNNTNSSIDSGWNPPKSTSTAIDKVNRIMAETCNNTPIQHTSKTHLHTKPYINNRISDDGSTEIEADHSMNEEDQTQTTHPSQPTFPPQPSHTHTVGTHESSPIAMSPLAQLSVSIETATNTRTSVSPQPKPNRLSTLSMEVPSATNTPLTISTPNTPFTPIDITPSNNMPRLDSWGAIFCFFSVGMGRRWYIYSPIILHIWDTATDFGVIIEWLRVAEFQGFWTVEVTSLYYAVLAILSMVLYRVVSGIAVWRTLGWKSGIAQFLDILVYREVYEAYVDEKIRPTIHFRWIRRMEATFESFPQSLIQIVWLLKTEGEASFLMIASILLSVYSISSSIIKDDEWKFGGKDSAYRKKCPPHAKFLLRGTFRLCEILARQATLALLWLQTTGYYLSGWIIYNLIFYFMLFKKDKLGRDPGNIFAVFIGYPNLSYRDNDYREMNCLIRLFGVFVLWTPFDYLSRKKWNNVTIFYASRFTENLIILLGSAVFEWISILNFVDLSGFVVGAFIVGFFCNFYSMFVYFRKVRNYLNGLEKYLNLDIWGVLKQSTEDIDMLQRYIKRAPNTIHKIKDDGTTTLMEAAKHSDLTVLLCILHGDVYYNKSDTLREEITSIQLFEYNERQYKDKQQRLKDNKFRWEAPNGYQRDIKGRTCIYYLIQQHTTYCNHNRSQLWRQHKDFKKRREWLLVFMKHIIYHPPTELNDKIEYQRTGHILGFVDENDYLLLLNENMINRQSMMRGISGGITNTITTMLRGQSKNDVIVPIYDAKRKNTSHTIINQPPSKVDAIEDDEEVINEYKKRNITPEEEIRYNNNNRNRMGLQKQFSHTMTSESGQTPIPQDVNNNKILLNGPQPIMIQDSMEREMGNFSTFSKQIAQKDNMLTPIQNQKIFLNMADIDGKTALHWATYLDSMDFLNLLLELGADPNIYDGMTGETAMHLAVRKDRYEILDAFIIWNNKVKEWMEEENNNNNNNKEEIIKGIMCDWYIKDNMGADVIFACINYDRPDLLNDLYVSDIEVFRLDEQQNTILQWAIKRRQDECVKEILKRDMLSIELLINKNIQHKGALEMAVLAQNIHIVEVLIDHFTHKIEMDLYDGDNGLLYNEIMDCLNKSIELKFTNVLRVFFQHGKNIILRDNMKCHEMLKKIVNKQHNDHMLEICCVYLSECLTLKNKNGETLIFYCIEYDKPKLLKLLINKFKCNINICNNDGYDLLKYCDYFDRPTCKHFIQQYIQQNN